jgi:hypothetical protein
MLTALDETPLLETKTTMDMPSDGFAPSKPAPATIVAACSERLILSTTISLWAEREANG